ncbi:MAG TPA: hypothetical protein VNL95_08015 [Dehalococcoidia bacterium]|nr:hypothetical protein [Dehalococcoidia bacterium]
MTGALPLNPVHLLALVSPLCRLQADEARPWERLAGQPAPPPWEVALEHMPLLAQRRRGWVLLGLARVRGLLTARRRRPGGAWEVDCLQVAPGDIEAAARLLETACGQLGQEGVQRLFLRLEAESPLLRAACRAGFFPLRQERLYRLSGEHRLHEASPERLLPLTRGHLSALFQLYNASVPASVRCLEGMTLRDWQAAQEPWSQPQDVALWDGGRILAWARLATPGRSALLSLMLHPEAQARARQLVASVLEMVPSQRPLFCLVAAYQPAVASALEEAGLEPVADYLVLMRHLLQRQAHKTAEPERVGGAVPVS